MTIRVVAAAEPPTFRPLPAGLDTPRLVVDLARVEANITRLQAELAARGVALRPHAKTHKSVAIARMQLAAGACGLRVGTLGEAEVFLAAGIDDVFVAYPMWADGPKAARIRALHEASTAFRVGVDSVGGAERLAATVAGSAGGRRLRVLVELDPGLHRTGVATPEAAAEVARAARAAGLEVEGVFSHGGHGYRPGAAVTAGGDEVRTLTAAAAALADSGIEVRTISAGATPTMLTAATGPVNEIRAGTYVLGDRQQLVLGTIAAEGCAVAVAATVVSVFDDRVVLDAGAKALTKDRADWLEGYGAVVGYPDVTIDRLNDYHGVVLTPPGVARPNLGEVVAIVPNHICPVIDLADSFVAIAADGATDIWPVDARGRSG
ncbi:MAG TPA: alanine racemase [Candidatus Bathyarchaeia archaeon]|nr:alanine racemase [Candidatus Bathyarchaeia archaeon]